MHGDDWITTQEASEISGYHPDHLRRLIRAGDIEGRKVSIVWLIKRQSLLDYIAHASNPATRGAGLSPLD